MRLISLTAAAAWFLAIAATTANAADQRPYAPKIGERHPDLTLRDISTGKPITLSSFRGKKVLLIQFASW